MNPLENVGVDIFFDRVLAKTAYKKSSCIEVKFHSGGMV